MKGKFKLLVASLACVIALSAQPVVSFADSNVSVMINDEYVEFDNMPVIDNGRTLVPFRPIFEAIGMTVEYEPIDKIVAAENDDYLVVMQIDNIDFAVVEYTENGYTENWYQFDVPPKIIDGRTYIPVGAVFGAIDYSVTWDSATKTVILEDISYPEENVVSGNDYDETYALLENIVEFEYLMVSAFGEASYYIDTDKDYAIDEFNYIKEECLYFKENDFSYVSEELETNTNEFADIMVTLCEEAIIVTDAVSVGDYETAALHAENIDYYLELGQQNTNDLFAIIEAILG